MNKKSAFSSPNKMVWQYFDCLRRSADRALQANTESMMRQETAICIIMAVTIIEIFLNLYLRIVIEEDDFSKNKNQILNDMKNRCSLDWKLKKWPKLIFGKHLNLESGPGKHFIELKSLRNNLVHFKSTWDSVHLPGIVIKGAADTTVYDSLKPRDAERSIIIAEEMLAEVFRLRGIKEEQIPNALHLWAAKVPPKRGA